MNKKGGDGEANDHWNQIIGKAYLVHKHLGCGWP